MASSYICPIQRVLLWRDRKLVVFQLYGEAFKLCCVVLACFSLVHGVAAIYVAAVDAIDLHHLLCKFVEVRPWKMDER